jgi:hypothetical protein
MRDKELDGLSDASGRKTDAAPFAQYDRPDPQQANDNTRNLVTSRKMEHAISARIKARARVPKKARAT